MHVDFRKKNPKYVASILDYLVEVHVKINVKFPVLIIAHCLKYHDSKIHFIVVVICILSNAIFCNLCIHFCIYALWKPPWNLMLDIFDLRIPCLCFGCLQLFLGFWDICHLGLFFKHSMQYIDLQVFFCVCVVLRSTQSYHLLQLLLT